MKPCPLFAVIPEPLVVTVSAAVPALMMTTRQPAGWPGVTYAGADPEYFKIVPQSKLLPVYEPVLA